MSCTSFNMSLFVDTKNGKKKTHLKRGDRIALYLSYPGSLAISITRPRKFFVSQIWFSGKKTEADLDKSCLETDLDDKFIINCNLLELFNLVTAITDLRLMEVEKRENLTLFQLI
jgi:hypothetical protein